MNARLIRTIAAITATACLTTSCQNLTPGENAAVFGTAAGLATAIPLAAAGVDSSIVVPVSLGAAALAAGGAYVIAKHQASENQRKIAEQRARLYIERQNERRQSAAAQSASTASKKPKSSRYIAVETVKEGNSTGAKQVMVFDTQSNEIVGNNVYDVKSTPKVGQVSKFDTYSAEYVESGS